MPDISMCRHPDCPARHTCYRHSASGTRPSEFRQSYGDFRPDLRGRCGYYFPVRSEEQGESR